MKNIIVSAMAIAAFGTAALAQTGQPNQPPRGDQPGRPGEGRMMGKGGRGERGGDRGSGMRGPMMGSGFRGGMMNFERLNLTDAQKQRIQTIQESARTSREANKAQFEEFGNLMRLKREGLLTTEQGTRLNALQVQMQTQMTASMEKMRNDIMAVLTPDQKTLLEQNRMGRPDGAPNRGGMPRVNAPGAPPAPTNN